MPIELACSGCGRQLRVADEHAGKPLRCPACGQIGAAPSGVPDDAMQKRLAGTTSAMDSNWHMRTPEGQTYGPVPRSDLDAWAREGRLTADCQLAQHPSGPWRYANWYLPHLPHPQRDRPAATFTPASPFASGAAQPAVEMTVPQVATAGRYVAPHRGALILILGILGFFVNCPIFSFMAWVMGSQDLHDMRTGRMDRSGEGLTQAGYFLGMIWSILWIVGAIIIGMIFLFAAVAGN